MVKVEDFMFTMIGGKKMNPIFGQLALTSKQSILI